MVRKNTPPLFSSQLFIAVIDIFYMVSKNILDNSEFLQKHKQSTIY